MTHPAVFLVPFDNIEQFTQSTYDAYKPKTKKVIKIKKKEKFKEIKDSVKEPI